MSFFLNASFYRRDLGIVRRVQSLSLLHLVCYLVGLDSGTILKRDLSSMRGDIPHTLSVADDVIAQSMRSLHN